MKREKLIGAGLGLVGVLLGFICVTYFFGGNLSDIGSLNVEGKIFVVLGLAFSMLFGSQAASKMQKGKLSPFLLGVLSSVYTTICTITVAMILIELRGGHFEISDFIGSWFFVLVYSLIFGGIPMVIIGGLFGWTLQRILRLKNKES